MPKDKEKDKLISCNHIDTNADMVCDKCDSALPFSNNMVSRSVEASIQTIANTSDSVVINTTEQIRITGNMPKDAEAKVSKLTKQEAQSMAQKYKKEINTENIEYAYDISLNSANGNYQPNKYNQSVNVKLSNLNLDKSKTYALLHVIDDKNYEILPCKVLNEKELQFTASSFSVYIVITVGTNKVTFEGENFKVLNEKGNIITDGTTVADGTNLRFIIEPNDNYGITNVTSSAGGLEVFGGVRGKECNIPSVTGDITISITTVLAPLITTQPSSIKVEVGTEASFTVEATNATTYEWQYRESSGDLWKSASTIAENTSATFTIPSVEYNTKDYEYRCLLGNANFTNHERVVSEEVKIFVAEDNISTEVQYVGLDITKQPTSQKVKMGEIATFTIQANEIDTYKWQYKPSGDEVWYEVDDTIGEGYTTNTLKVDTSDMTIDENLVVSNSLSGTMFRCVISSSVIPTYSKSSDEVYLSIAQGEIKTNEVKLEISVSRLTVTLSPTSYIYDGKAKTPTVTVIDGTAEDGTILTDGVDYTVTHDTTTDVGTKNVTITGKGNYTGTVSKTFTITQATNTIKVTEKTGVTYNKTAQELVTIEDAQGEVYYAIGTELTSSNYITEGSTTIPTGTDAGNYTVYYYAMGNNNYTLANGSVTVTIGAASINSSTTVEVIADQKYTGSAITPEPIVKWNNTIPLTKDVDYTLGYENNTNPGTATITITGKGNFEGEIAVTFTIIKVKIPAPIITAKLNSYTGEEYTGTLTNKSIAIELTSESPSKVYKYEWSNKEDDGFTSVNLITTSEGIGRILLNEEMFGKVYFRSVDELNNYSEISTIEVKIDRTSPTGSINIKPVLIKGESKYTNSSEVEIILEAIDNYSSPSDLSVALINEKEYEAMNNDEQIEWISFAEQKSFILTEGEGLRKVYIIIKDEAGNQSMYLAK